MKTEDMVTNVVEAAGGKIDSMGMLPDGSGFATASFPLPKDHWLTQAGFDEPPMPLRVGVDERIEFRTEHVVGEMTRKEFAAKISEAAKYAIRASTMNGNEIDFDPDAMVGNMIVGMLGYWTSDGKSKL